jgi:hypothetical protein
MKKQLILAALLTGIAASSFAQGYCVFGTSGKSWVWDNFSTPGTSQVGGTAGANINLAFLIGSTANTPLLGNTGNGSGNTTAFSQSAGTTIWTDIMSDPNFTIAHNQTGGAIVQTPVNTSSLVRGGWSFGGGSSFQVQNFVGGSYKVVVVGWDAAYATLAAAQAANAAVGWSSAFTYTLQPDLSTAPSTFNGSGMTAFGVTPITVAAVPEPSTMALAALGGASLLLFRRRK